MSDYSYQDVLRMQSEAKKRVLEMQKRSRDAAENFSGRHHTEKPKEEAQPEAELPRVPKSISYPTEIHSQSYRTGTSGHSSFNRLSPPDIRKALTGVFGNLTADEYEKMFILSLCLLLSKEKGDDSLIFALMYLLT